MARAKLRHKVSKLVPEQSLGLGYTLKVREVMLGGKQTFNIHIITNCKAVMLRTVGLMNIVGNERGSVSDKTIYYS